MEGAQERSCPPIGRRLCPKTAKAPVQSSWSGGAKQEQLRWREAPVAAPHPRLEGGPRCSRPRSHREVEDHRRGEMRDTEKGEDKVGEEWLGVWMRF
jgi:hypothetical protein